LCLLHLLAAASLSDFVGAAQAQDGVELELAAEYYSVVGSMF
jgi:hypothetical protein